MTFDATIARVGPIPGADGIIWINAPWSNGLVVAGPSRGIQHNGSSFRSLAAHTAASVNEPGLGASWQTYWAPLSLGTYQQDIDAGRFSGTAEEWLEVYGAPVQAASEAVAAAGTASTKAGLATDAAAAAQAARDAAQVGAEWYPDTTAGLAGTSDGDFFRTPALDDAESFVLWLNDEGVAAEQQRYPSALAVDRVAEDNLAAARAAADGYDTLGQRASGTLFNSSLGFLAWGVGVDVGTDIAVGDMIDAIGLDMAFEPEATKIRVQVLRRLSSGGGENAVPEQTSDVTVLDTTVTLASLGVLADIRLQHILLPLATPIRAIAGTTLFLLARALDADDDPVATGMAYLTTSGEPGRRRGYKIAEGEGWSAVSGTTTSLGWHLYRTKRADQSIARALPISLTGFAKPVASRAGGSGFSYNSNFNSWVAGVVPGTDMAAGAAFDTVVMPMQINPASSPVSTLMRLWRRALDSASLNAGPGAAGDELLETVTTAYSEMGLAAGTTFGRAAWSVSPRVAEAGYVYLLEVHLLDADNEDIAYGVQRHTETFAEAYRRGFYRNTTNPLSWQTVASGSAIAFELTQTAYRPSYEPSDLSPVDRLAGAGATIDGLDVTIDPAQTQIERQGELLPVSGTVTMTAPTTGSVVDEAVTITYPASGEWSIGTGTTGRLDHFNLSNVVAKDASTMAVLVEGTDYVVNYAHGRIVRAGAGADRPVLVSYDWSDTRYDLIYVDPETLGVGVVEGEESMLDAPDRGGELSGPSQIPLYAARVTADEVELIPVWDVDRGARRRYKESLDLLRAKGRAHLRPILKKLRAGLPVTIASYGDSICAFPGGLGTSATVPNGVLRDIPGYFSGYYGTDLTDALPRYDFGDGGGAIHVKASQIWQAILALEAAYDSTITYLNMSIGGTNSAATTGNGTHPTRLAALTGSAADLVIIGFGMNELGASATEANIVAIIDACLAVGKSVIVLGSPRQNTEQSTDKLSAWLFTQRALQRAAAYRGVGYVDYVSLYSPDNIGVMGRSGRDICSANAYNHPGIREHRILGAAIAALLLDDYEVLA